MRLFQSTIMFILLAACAITKTSTDQKKIVITGQLTYVDKYCGGAPPSRDLIESLRVPKPLTAYTLMVRQGNENDINKPIIKEVKTNEKGEFQLELPVGEYVLLTQFHENDNILNSPQKHVQIVEHEKLNDWWKSGLAVINSSTSINRQFHKRCYLPLGVPGLHYTGPIAP